MKQKMINFGVMNLHTAHRTPHTAHRIKWPNWLKILTFTIFILVSNILHSQEECGTISTPEEYQNLISFIQSLNPPGLNSDNCNDVNWNGGSVHYRMVWEYSSENPNTSFSKILNLAKDVKEFYSQYGIKLSIQIVNVGGIRPTFDDFDENSANYPNCIYGIIANTGSIGGNAYGGVGGGKFWSVDSWTTHEIGHALGLLHTFHEFSEFDHEVITPNPSTCPCNCKQKGDLVCDIPVNPYVQNNSSWNNQMFNLNGSIKNDLNKLDICGSNYLDVPDQYRFFRNVMSYRRHLPYILSDGQVALIKYKNLNKPWSVSSGDEGVIAMEGFEINTPTVFYSDMIFSTDLIIKQRLDINNCKILMANGAKIITKNGAGIFMNNASIERFDDRETCAELTSIDWGGIHVDGITRISMKNNSYISLINNTAIQSNGKTLFLNMKSNSRILTEGKVFDLKNGHFELYINNGIIGGESHLSNSGGTLTAKGTTFFDNIEISNVNVNISDDCNVQSHLNVDNSLFRNVNVNNNSYFQGLIGLISNSGTTSISNNSIYITGTNVPVNITKLGDYIIRNNNFYGGAYHLYYNAAAPNSNNNLLFKNQFHLSTGSFGSSIENYSNQPGLNIECNEFNVQGNAFFDLGLSKEVAEKQGDLNFVAGNLFSGPPREVFYNVNKRLNYYFKNPTTREEPVNVQGSFASQFVKHNLGINTPSKCDVLYPTTPVINPPHCFNGVMDGNESGVDCGGSCLMSCQSHSGGTGVKPNYPSHCYNGMQDGNEAGIDCGGSCPPCFTNHCNDGDINGDETGVDCGGADCPPCNTDYCNDGIQNNGETGIDCGGPCGPCFVNSCTNGLWDGDETGIDCGGSCTPCAPTCFDGIQNGEETGVDCGGGCPSCGGNCSDGIQNNGEYWVDCGGPCNPCIFDDYNLPQEPDYTDFVSFLSTSYGTSYFPLSDDINIQPEINQVNSLLDNGNTTYLVNLINSQSVTDPIGVETSLGNNSPNLSPKVFHTLFENSEYYTENQIANLLVLNPGVLNDMYVKYIVYESNSFDSINQNLIKKSYEVGDARVLLNQKMETKKLYMHHLIRNRMDYYLSLPDPDYHKIRLQLGKKDNTEAIYQVYESYIAEGKYSQAKIYLEAFAANDISDPYYKNQLLKYREVESILFDYYYAGNIKVNMPSSFRQQLIDISETDNGLATHKARNIMKELYGMTFSNYPGNTFYKPLEFLQNSSPRTSKALFVDVRPNPFQNLINISIRGEISTDIVSKAVLYDVNGQQKSDTRLVSGSGSVETKSLSSGVYFLKVFSGEKIIHVQKLVKVD
ncbi:MAG: T9SS type A sorting domain-containing protein [Saprospiraceae bacterium]|nr:T9SS type A sorting domain-containing protein [Saprospiraceae bacterium]